MFIFVCHWNTWQLIGLYRENAIAIESEAKDPFGGNVYYVTMQITVHIPEFARKEPNLHCDVVHTSKEPVCPRVELILKIIIILLIIFLGFIKSKPC